MGQVQECGGFVEEQHARLLGQCHRDPHPLPLTAGQLGDAPRGQRADVGAFHGGADLLVVLVGPLVQHALVRIPATADQFVDSDALGGYRGLRQEADLPREGLGAHPGDLPTVEQDGSRTRRQHLAQRPQQGGLAASVRPDDHGERPRLNGDIEARHDIGATGVSQMEVPALQHEGPGFVSAQPRTALTIWSRTTRAAVGPAFRKNGSSSTLTACPALTAFSEPQSACPVSSSSLPPWIP